MAEKNNNKESIIKEICGYRWLNPWLILGDIILLIILINLIITMLFKPYSIIAITIDLILIPIQLISYWVLARKWRNKNREFLIDWIIKRRRIK